MSHREVTALHCLYRAGRWHVALRALSAGKGERVFWLALACQEREAMYLRQVSMTCPIARLVARTTTGAAHPSRRCAVALSHGQPTAKPLGGPA
jgi:hypothetical protein